MYHQYINSVIETFGKEYGEVIVGVASRIREVPSLFMGSFSIPEHDQGTPGELDLLVPTAEHRYKLLWQLQGIFRHLNDGGVLFCDGGAELDLRLRVYTCEDLGVDLDWFKRWWAASHVILPEYEWLRLPQVDVSMALLLLRDEEDDITVARLILDSGYLGLESEMPPRVFALAAQLYADHLHKIADDLEELGEELE